MTNSQDKVEAARRPEGASTLVTGACAKTANSATKPFETEGSRNDSDGGPSGNFKDLIEKERQTLNRARLSDEDQPVTISKLGRAQEPWVAFTPDDSVGLALSGGGIRSATFNLGLLQAFKQKGVLGKCDYLSTVSGGGYTGGFWTRWWLANAEIRQKTACGQKDFPGPEGKAHTGEAKGPKEIREPAEIRHLREFSRFLIPRKGLTTEFWSAVITLLTGFVPSMMAAVAAVVLATIIWAYLAALVLVAVRLTLSIR